MSEQHEFSFAPKSEPPFPATLTEEQATEFICNYPEEEVRKRYKELIGQFPKGSIKEENLISAFVDPKKERDRVLSENLAEDHEDVTRTNRGTPREE
jgi:hypothetical protein